MPRRALVLERDRATSELLRRCLERLDFEVDCTDRSDAALRRATTLAPDVFMINLNPVGLCGIEVAAELRTRGFRHTPMIAIANSQAMVRVAGLYDLFEAYLLHPLELDYVSHLVRVLSRAGETESRTKQGRLRLVYAAPSPAGEPKLSDGTRLRPREE